MAAFNSGTSAGRRRAKDQAMAAAMKDTPQRAGVERHTMNCPCCHKPVPRERLVRGRMIADGLASHLNRCR